MENAKIQRLINDVGMAMFVKYYHAFKELDRDKAIMSITEDITDKSKGTRTSKAHKIFKDRLNIEVLELICASTRVDDMTLKKAKEILAFERKA